MNKERRKVIAEIIDKLNEIKDDIQMVADEENEYKDNMPENLQQGERGEKAEEACYALDEALSSIDDAISNLEDAQQ